MILPLGNCLIFLTTAIVTIIVVIESLGISIYFAQKPV
jgi:hypothetical protein